MDELISDKGICRTAPATLGLLKSLNLKLVQSFDFIWGRSRQKNKVLHKKTLKQ